MLTSVKGCSTVVAGGAGGLKETDQDFKVRRQLIDALDIRAILVLEDGEKVVYVWCALGEEVYPVASDTTCGTIPPIYGIGFWCKMDS